MANSNSNSEQIKEEYSAAGRESIVVQYKECWKNHAVSVGGYAADGCREFTPKGDEGSKEAFLCQACDCHRNFHRKQMFKNGVALEESCSHHFPYPSYCPTLGEKFILGFYPLQTLSQPSHQQYLQQQPKNIAQRAGDEESVICSGSQSDRKVQAVKRPKICKTNRNA